MDPRTKELIAIGVSIGTHCQPCLAFHLGKVREMGIDEKEIREAIEVGYMVEKGALTTMRKYESQLFDPAQTQNPTCCPGENPGCCK